MIYQNYIQTFMQTLTSWFFSHGIKVLIILFITWLVSRGIKLLVSRLINTLMAKGEKVIGTGILQEQRVNTLTRVLKSTTSTIIWIIAVLTILPEFGVDIAPLLAGAGLVGLAIGMGAKSLIQDYLSGIFILLEDQYRVGENVSIGGTEGNVVEFNLRLTSIKDEKGIMHHIPNGQIKTASNFSRK